MALSKLKNTPSLVLFVILISVGVTSASALTITFGGDLIEVLGILNMNNNKITNVGTPTASTDGATKGYVDSSPTTDTLAGLSCSTNEIPRWDGSIWVCTTPIVKVFSPVATTVDESSASGIGSSTAIGTDGLPVISYHDQTNNDLKVVHCGDIDCAENINSNTITTLDSTDNVGFFTSIAIGSDNLPVISYWDRTNSDLKVVHCGDIDCAENINSNTITTVDSTDNVGDWPSIAIGFDNLPVISYWDRTNSDLKVVHCGDIDCAENINSNTITTVDSTDNVGFFTSIAIGSDNLPVISYSDSTNNDLKAVHCGDIDCAENINSNTITTLDSTDSRHTSIAIGSDDRPVISYADHTNGNLKVVHCTHISCSTFDTPVILDSGGGGFSTLGDTSIAIAIDNNPVIIYRTLTGLKVVHCSNASCSTFDTPIIVDSSGAVGDHNSIAIGSDNHPVMSYFDGTNFHLKVAYCSSPLVCDMSVIFN